VNPDAEVRIVATRDLGPLIDIGRAQILLRKEIACWDAKVQFASYERGEKFCFNIPLAFQNKVIMVNVQCRFSNQQPYPTRSLEAIGPSHIEREMDK
jgi:hypothetical protein